MIRHLLQHAAPAAQPIQFVGASFRDGAGSLAYPTGYAVGDLLIIFALATGTSIATPAGWTAGPGFNWSGYGYRQQVFARIADAAGSADAQVGLGVSMMLAYRHASGLGAAGSWVQGDSAYLYLPALTPTSSDSLVIGHVFDRDPAIPTKPASWTARVATAGTYIGAAAADFAPADQAGAPSWTQSTASYAAAGCQIEVVP